MGKSVYSLVLNDEVVDIIDKMARINGLSRSNMIEKILAQATNYETPEFIDVTVSDPELVINGSEKYTVYTVRTHSSHHEYHPGDHVVKRRYNQFLSLRHQLKHVRDNSQYANNWGKIPKLPGDTFGSFFIPSYRFKPEFTEERAKGLQLYINAVLKHPTYLFSQIVIDFLTKPDFEIVQQKTKIIWGNGDNSSSDEL